MQMMFWRKILEDGNCPESGAHCSPILGVSEALCSPVVGVSRAFINFLFKTNRTISCL
jgi:hypothetical protein